MGFGRDKNGTLKALDVLSEYAYRLGIDDELKFRQNQKSYQEISFEQAGLIFKKEEYLFDLDSDSLDFADKHLRRLGIFSGSDRPLVGLNTGSGTRFAGKKLPAETWAALADKFYLDSGATVLLLGGKDEIERNARIAALAKYPVVQTGSHSIQRFAALVRACRVVLSGDTTAMHIAIAVKTPVIAYFASTCAPEIELYGRGKKIVSGIDCAPCYKKICPINEKCMTDFEAEPLYQAALEYLKSEAVRG